MDFLPDKEFHVIFERTSETVDLQGATSVDEINRILDRRIRKAKRRQRRGIPQGIILRNLDNLRNAGFARRTIEEAVTKPRGIEALTLKYGNEKAKDILLRRARRRIGEKRRLVGRRRKRR